MGPGKLALVGAASLLLLANTTQAYLVQNAASLEELTQEAELVCKGVVIASKPAKDDWFTPVGGFEVRATELEVISVLKGKPSAKRIHFLHYATAAGDVVSMYQPQHYDFTVGRAYVVFADKTRDQWVFRQIWKPHRSKEDQGVLLAADKRPHKGKTIAQVFWLELKGLIDSREPDDVLYGIRQLDRMSGGAYDDLQHFERRRVLEVLVPLLSSNQPKVAEQAVRAMGSRNPYLSDDFASYWLATIGEGEFPGLGKWDRKKEYLGGKLFWRELAAVANSKNPQKVRALAVRALGRSGRSEVYEHALAWVKDPLPEIRQAGALLLADFPERVQADLVNSLAEDESPLVRKAAARLIGFGRLSARLPALGRMLGDRDPKVAAAAALSLLSFSVERSRKILEANLGHPQFKPLFVNALARKNPEAYLDSLGAIIRTGARPDLWWGGRVPWGISWEILFRYAQEQPAANLESRKMNSLFDSLENPLSAKTGGPVYYSSSEPRDLYALYLQRGLKERARKFRRASKKALSYDIDYYFDMVDKSPDTYQRR